MVHIKKKNFKKKWKICLSLALLQMMNFYSPPGLLRLLSGTK